MDDSKMDNQPQSGQPSTASYISGFILSLELTLAAYILAARHILSHQQLVATIVGLAIAQLLAQLVFFLHLGRESKPRWNLAVFAFMTIVLVILVFGSLWIMYNLNYHAGPHVTDTSIIKDEGISH